MTSTSHIWSSFSNYIRAFVAKRVSNSTDVDDIMQDVFLKVHLNLSSIKKEGRLQSWLFSITRNVIHDFYRKQSKRGEQELNFDIAMDDEDAFDQLKDCLRPFIDKLPAKYKRPLYLSDVKGIKQKDVARLMKLSESATKSRVQRAREMVKSNFIDCCKFEVGEDGKLKGEHAH